MSNQCYERITMTLDEISGILGVSKSTIRRMIAIGDFPDAVRMGRCLRWLRSDILEWLKTR
jgi:excisionase family DNA binding protein